ncbi:MAG: DUF2791 family P-loop domain-containing protein [Eubacterium sp.]|nr:DUF2791 family P-loop domain-containing protein [Eubacterium sp.]
MIDKKLAESILHTLEGGMGPENGLPYIAVGRKEEVEVITRDMDRIAQGYSTFRLLEGAYGTGKSFMAQLIKNEALLRDFLVMDCELAAERKLCGSKKEGLETYRVLMSRLSSRSCPNGKALEHVLGKYVEKMTASEEGQSDGIEADAATDTATDAANKGDWPNQAKKEIQQMPHGYDFYEVLTAYVEACRKGDSDGKDNLLRWFRGEYANKTAARKACGISVVIEDENWFSYLKIWAVFFKEIGYTGLYVILDELTQITRNIVNSTTREHNFERLLSMYNDCYGNGARNMGIILCGIPSSIHDSRRGIFSYEALKSRLDVSSLQGDEILGTPIIKLSMLTPEEFAVLLERVEGLHAMLHDKEYYFSEEDRILFVDYEYRRIGAVNHLTPREFLRDFLTILNLKAEKRQEDSMEDFLYKGTGLETTPSMIGQDDLDDLDEEDTLKYEGFTV